MTQKFPAFFKKESILCVASLLACVSAFFVPPDGAYVAYLNLHVMTLLFCLMAIMGGFQSMGLFSKCAIFLLKKAKDLRQLTLILVLLCFFSAMVVTNDVALITFVPFTILLLKAAGLTHRLIPILVLQTIGANLGSMLTPIGNPQNLYLYTISGMTLPPFLMLMLPYTLVSLLLLVVFSLLQKPAPLSITSTQEAEPYDQKERRLLMMLTLLFGAALLTVFGVVHYYLLLALVLLWFLWVRPKVLRDVDYFLLLTFLAFFVLIGNLGRMDFVRTTLQNLLHGRELLVAFFSSQFISNVPAAVLLSEFTTAWRPLLVGVNIGGLGTLIASMASLISYKYFAQEVGAKKMRYLLIFTGMNLIFAILLLALAFLLPYQS